MTKRYIWAVLYTKIFMPGAGMLPCLMEARTFDHTHMLYQFITGLCTKCTHVFNTLYAQECRMIRNTEK
jgi:hypothetical protein